MALITEVWKFSVRGAIDTVNRLTAAMVSKVLVKRLKREFPVDVVKAAVLYGVQKLGYDQPTVDQSSILQDNILANTTNGQAWNGSHQTNSKLEAT